MMIVLKYLELGQAPGNRRQKLTNPSWSDIASRINALDAGMNSDLSIVREESEELTIGGGRGNYVVSFLRGDGTNGTLLNRSAEVAGETTELVVGGQPSRLPSRCIVDSSAVLRVARAFVEGGTMDTFEWD